ncbi:transporter [Shewanella sp. SR44-3]|uniref:transporter n=1 Tax=Shewanella sp. SR44-3 TaxID=2760936 RepID=UPI0015FAA29C|nr:transporter [Shewanella sp. SR44-3]MBB1268896.1 transporter [Shewanella sp. SR44-3]
MNIKWTSATAALLPGMLVLHTVAAETQTKTSEPASQRQTQTEQQLLNQTSGQELNALKQKLIILNKQLKIQQQTINQMAQQVLKQEAYLQSVSGRQPAKQAVAVNSNDNIERKTSMAAKTPAPQIASTQETRKKAPDRGRSTDDLLQETHNVFTRKLTIEPSFTYSYYSRKDLILRGFLALDAIFLGNLNLDRVRTNTTQLDLTTRYTLNQDWQFEIGVPYMFRWTQYDSVGEGNSSQRYETAQVDGGGIGDMSAAVYYRINAESTDWPDWVWNVRLRAPTGNDPFGIDLETSEFGNLTYPTEVATGSGVWGASTGFSLAKTFDPAIVFFNLNYGWTREEEFDDLSGNPGLSPGKIDLGDYLDYSLGLAFAVSERMSLAMSFNQRFYTKTKQQPLGGPWEKIPRTDTNTASLGIGATIALSENLSMVTSIGAGLTEDSPDYQISLRFPYRF